MSKIPETKRTPVVSVRCVLSDSTPDSMFDHIVVTLAGQAPFTLAPSGLTEEIQRYATLHGLKQKLVDAAAISRNPGDGSSATPADKAAAVQDVLSRLLAGEWNKRREGSPTGGLLLRALAVLYPAKAREQLVEFLATKTDAEKAALRRNPKVSAIIEEIRAADGEAADVDTDEMLAGLDDSDDSDE
jgi:hypothetical protein